MNNRRQFLAAMAAFGAGRALAAHHDDPHRCDAEADKCKLIPATPNVITRGSQSYRLYTIGKGPAIFLLHEVPGVWPCDITLACRLADRGYTVYVPVFFGKLGENRTNYYLLTQTVLPFSPFFLSAWLPKHTPRHAKWLAEMIPQAHRDCGGEGVGVIGMCLTGALPLALLKVQDVKAAVLCQPTNPFLFQRSLDLSTDDLNTAKRRLERDKMRVLALKFSGDGKSKDSRFDRLCKELQGHYSELIIESGSPGGIVKNASHSVLAGDYDGLQHKATHQAFERVIRYLDHRLKGNSTTKDYPLNPSEDCPRELFKSCKDSR